MTGMELLVILAISWGVARVATRDARALVRGENTPRTRKWKAARKARKAMKGRGRGAGRYGIGDYTADLWHDSWEDARVRREARRANRPEGWETRPGQARRAGGWLARKWEQAWAAAIAKRLGEDWWNVTDECPECGKDLAGHDIVDRRGAAIAVCRDQDDAPEPEQPPRQAGPGGPAERVGTCPSCGGGLIHHPPADRSGSYVENFIACERCGRNNTTEPLPIWADKATELIRNADPASPPTPAEKPAAPEKCQACGRDGTDADPLVTDDGYRIHRSHLSDPSSGLYAGPERSLYDNQPYSDLTGVPDEMETPCEFSGCRGTLRPVPGSQHFDPDGDAWVELKCDICTSGRDTRWKWTDYRFVHAARFEEETEVIRQGFQYELCPECGKDFDGHDIVSDPLGHAQTACRTGGDQDAEYEVYDNQPYSDLTGVPAGLEEPCSREGCGGTYRPIPGTQNFDADGGAAVSRKCDRGCGMESPAYWGWTDNPPAENPDYYDDPDDDDRDEDLGGPAAGGAAALVAGKQPAAAPASYFHAERNGQELAVVYPMKGEHNMSEVTGLETAIHYAHNLTHSTGSAEVVAGLEAFEADLGSHGVSGDAVAALQEGRDHLSAAHACFSRVHSALDKQRNVGEAYAATPGAGSREFVTSE